MPPMNMIGAMLCKAPPAFGPILYEGEAEGGGTIVVAHDWCAGFLARVKLTFDDWQPRLGDESNNVFLVPLVKLGPTRVVTRSALQKTRAPSTTNSWTC
jgi:hypothetical protein